MDKEHGTSLLFWSVLLLVLLFGPSFMDRYKAESREQMIQESEMVIVSELDRLMGEPNDNGYYTVDIVSSTSDKDFTLRRIVDDRGNSKYEVIAELKSGDYTIFNINENNIRFNILKNKEDKPRMEVKFMGTNLDYISYVNIYLPSKYNIETVSDKDSLSYDVQVQGD